MAERDLETLEQMPHDPSGPLEHQPQPDPMLQEGRAGSFRIWAIGLGIVAVLALVMYGVTQPNPQAARTASNGSEAQAPPASSPAASSPAGGAQAPSTAVPAGRGESGAPLTPNAQPQDQKK